MAQAQNLEITPEILLLISEIDEFKGAWRALGNLAPDKLLHLQKVATYFVEPAAGTRPCHSRFAAVPGAHHDGRIGKTDHLLAPQFEKEP